MSHVMADRLSFCLEPSLFTSLQSKVSFSWCLFLCSIPYGEIAKFRHVHLKIAKFRHVHLKIAKFRHGVMLPLFSVMCNHCHWMIYMFNTIWNCYIYLAYCFILFWNMTYNALIWGNYSFSAPRLMILWGCMSGKWSPVLHRVRFDLPTYVCCVTL